MEKKQEPIYVVSGGRGLAGNNMVQSILIQYPNNNVPVIIMPQTNNESQIIELLDRVKRDGGIITHTLVNRHLREFLIELCEKNQIKHVDFMGKLIGYLDDMLEVPSLQAAGLYREINQQYFDRIDAIEFTLNHDDGLSPERLHEAEIILTGVSRSGKTPLSVFLAMYGWKVANVPLVSGIEPPKELFEIDPKRVFGLNISPGQLISHRVKRLKSMRNTENVNYIDEKQVALDLRNSNFVFERGGFTIISVTNKPIETTAHEIMNIMANRFDYGGQRLDSPYHAEG